MIINKGKMIIELEEDVEKLNAQIEELLKVKDILINSSQYKLLYGKTQMIGEEQESIRSRLEHSQNISQIAQSIVAGIYDECTTEEQKKSKIFILNKTKELLYADIASLAHDLGHTPFGHNGEKTINQFMHGIHDKEQINRIIKKRIECFGQEYEEKQGHIEDNVTLSFEHNEQSALSFYNLLHNGEINLELIDINRMINIILSHSTTRVKECPEDLVAQVIRHTDKIEYRNKDFDELSKYIKPEKIRNKAYAEKTSEERIEEIKENIVKEAIEKGRIDGKMEALKELRQLRKDYESAIYFLENGRKGLLTSENIERNRAITLKLLEYYYANPDKISTKYFSPVTPLNPAIEEKFHSVYDTLKSGSDITRIEKAVNFVLSMDNRRTEKEYLKLVKQRIVEGEGIEPITPDEIDAIREEQEKEKIEKFKLEELKKEEQPHTYLEIRNIIRRNDEEFVNTMLTPEGIATMEGTRRKIEEDAKLDRLLYEQMEKADRAREENRRATNSEVINEIIARKTKPSEKERRQRAAEQTKKKWQQQLSSQGSETEEPVGR